MSYLVSSQARRGLSAPGLCPSSRKSPTVAKARLPRPVWSRRKRRPGDLEVWHKAGLVPGSGPQPTGTDQRPRLQKALPTNDSPVGMFISGSVPLGGPWGPGWKSLHFQKPQAVPPTCGLQARGPRPCRVDGGAWVGEAGPGGHPAAAPPSRPQSRRRRGNGASPCRDTGKVGFGHLLATLQTVLRPHLPIRPQRGQALLTRSLGVEKNK